MQFVDNYMLSFHGMTVIIGLALSSTLVVKQS